MTPKISDQLKSAAEAIALALKSFGSSSIEFTRLMQAEIDLRDLAFQFAK